jgi:hypothetical protein
MFDRKKHVRNDLDPFLANNVDGYEDVHVAIDFNVGIQASSIFAVRGGQMHFLDEMKGHADTEQLAIALNTKYGRHKIYAYPDPSGRARKSSAPVGRTDFTILQSYGITCLAHAKAPPIVDSVAAVNRKLMTASGNVSMFVSAHCPQTIMSLERTKWVDRNPDTASIDKSEGIEHFSDGIRYATEKLFPITNNNRAVAKGFGF